MGVASGHHPPELGSDAFDCPHPACGTYAQQTFGMLGMGIDAGDYGSRTEWIGDSDGWRVSQCARCRNYSFWLDEELLWPTTVQAGPPANPDSPPSVIELYNEARSVANTSPRSAAALLRLALQILVDELVPGNYLLRPCRQSTVETQEAPSDGQRDDHRPPSFPRGGGHLSHLTDSCRDARCAVVAVVVAVFLSLIDRSFLELMFPQDNI